MSHRPAEPRARARAGPTADGPPTACDGPPGAAAGCCAWPRPRPSAQRVRARCSPSRSGFAIATQVQPDPDRAAWRACARTTWSRILDDVSQEQRPAGRARSARLQASRDQLPSGSRLEPRRWTRRPGAAGHLGILAGTRRPPGPASASPSATPTHKVTAPIAARHPAGAARRRRRGGPDRRRAGRRRHLRSPTPSGGIAVGGQRVSPALRHQAIGDADDAGLGHGHPGRRHRDVRATGGGDDRRHAASTGRVDRRRRCARPSAPRVRSRPAPTDSAWLGVRPPTTHQGATMSELEYPEDLRYTAEHEWVRPGDDGTVRVGITAFAQDALGDVVYVSLPDGRRRGRRPATPAARSSRPRGSATSTRRSPARSRRATRRSTRPPSWSTPTPTARAGCTSCGRPTRRPWTAARRRGIPRPSSADHASTARRPAKPVRPIDGGRRPRVVTLLDEHGDDAKR